MRKILLSLLCFLGIGFPLLAEETLEYDLTFKKSSFSESIGAYDKTWTHTLDGHSWTVVNFNNNNKGWDYIKCGPKNSTTNASITTNFAAPSPLSKIEVNLGAVTNGSITDLSVFVSTDNSFPDGNTDQYSFGSISSGNAGIKTINIANPIANAYYRVQFTCNNTSSKGGVAQVDGIQYFSSGVVPPPTPTSLSAPEFSVGATTTVFPGTVITATCATEGSTVNLNVNDTETINGTEGAGTVEYTIPEDATIGSTYTLTATAFMAGNDDVEAKETTIKLTVAEKPKTVRDVLTAEKFNAGGGSYADYTYTSIETGISYLGHLMKNSSDEIQLNNSGSDKGIVVTQNSKGYTLRRVELVWGSSTLDTRQVDFYGNSSAYTSASQLYTTSSGEEIGSIGHAGTDILDVETANQYPYIGLRSNNGAVYLKEIILDWAVPEGYVEKTPVEIKWDDDVEQTYTVGDEGVTLTLDVTPEEALEKVVVTSSSEAVTVNYTDVPGLVALTFNSPAEDVTLTAFIKDDDTFADTESTVSFNVLPDMDGLIRVTLTAASFGLRNTQDAYENLSYTSPVTAITYVANMSVDNDAIQLRSSNSNSGIVTTSNPNGYILKRLEVEWSSKTIDARLVDIYGNHNPYSTASELYSVADNSNQGTQIGSIGVSGTDVLDVTDPEQLFPYIGIRSHSGALYINRIVLYWEKPEEVVEPGAVQVSLENVEDGIVTLSKGAEFEISSKNADKLSIVENDGEAMLVENPYFYTVTDDVDLTITPVDKNGKLYTDLTRELYIFVEDTNVERVTSTYTFDFKDDSYLADYSPKEGSFINVVSKNEGHIGCIMQVNEAEGEGSWSWNNNGWNMTTGEMECDLNFYFNPETAKYVFNKIVFNGTFDKEWVEFDMSSEGNNQILAENTWEGTSKDVTVTVTAYVDFTISSIDVTFEHDAVAQPYFEGVFENGEYQGKVVLKHPDPSHKIMYKIVDDNANVPMRASSKYGDDFQEADSEPVAFGSGDRLMMYAEHPHGMLSELYNDSFDNIVTGVDSILSGTQGKVRYFNLQGVEVAEPTEGIFIRVENGKATKIAK